MEHFITKIQIDKVRHLENIEICLNNSTRKNLLFTGKNGSGKTSVLKAMELFLAAINDENLSRYRELEAQINAGKTLGAYSKSLYDKYYNGIHVVWNDESTLDTLYADGNLITAFYAADRKTLMDQTNGVEDVKLETAYKANDDPAAKLIKYMVHLKTQQAYARDAGDQEIRDSIENWFYRFENALKMLLDDNTISLEYDYRNYNFLIHQKDRNPYDFNALSDGYSSVIRILSDLILRMDQNWLLTGALSEYNKEGVVLIDELETHLHIELQRKILPFLTEFFPRIQFIVSTHSPYILTSVDNAVVFDLEKQIELTNPAQYSAEDIAESYFDAENYSVQLEKVMERYRYLIQKENASADERAERAELKIHLKNISGSLAPYIRDELEQLEGELHG